jgi:hypothetical protein
MIASTELAITSFIDEYLQALSEIVEKNKKKIEDTKIKPWFPLEFPVEVRVFLTPKGPIIYYEKAEKFSVAFVKERPVKPSVSGEFIPYKHFEAWKGKAEKKAQSDVDSLLALPGIFEEPEQDLQEYYEGLQMESMEFDVDSYIDFLNKSNDAVTRTKKEAFGRLYELVTFRQNFLRNFEFLLRIDCTALDQLYFLIDSEMETSFDLALHGRYVSAMATLRKVLEVLMRALSLDCLADRTSAEVQLKNWTDNGETFGTFCQAVYNILSEDVDN